MVIVRAFYPAKTAEEQGYFVAEQTGVIISPHIFHTDTDAQKEAKAPGIVAWLDDPANIIEPHQVPLGDAKKKFKSVLDAVVAETNTQLLNRDGIYDGDDPEYFKSVWPEFFEFQRWVDGGRVGSRPATMRIDARARVLRDLVNDPGFTLGNARGRLIGQLRDRRFKLMAENIDAGGNLVDFVLRQDEYLAGQKEFKQREYSIINSDATLTDDEKANQIEALTQTMLRPNRDVKRFKFDDDPANPIVAL